MEYITAQELAAILKVTKDTIWRYTRTGRIPSIHLGARDYRYQIDAVIKALSAAYNEVSENALSPADPEKLRAFAGKLRPGSSS